MYPNPQEALPLTARPNLEHYRKLAKGLVKACTADDPHGIHAWTTRWLGRLGVTPARGILFEDALAGVEAGLRGGFGCVVGVGSGSQAAALLAQGAEAVIGDLSEVAVGLG